MLEINSVEGHKDLIELGMGRIKAYTEKRDFLGIMELDGEVLDLYDRMGEDQKLYTLKALCDMYPQVKKEKDRLANMEKEGRRELIVNDNTLFFIAKMSDNFYWISLKAKI